MHLPQLVEHGTLVEDSVTGNLLRIEEQLIYIRTSSVVDAEGTDAAWQKIKDVRGLVKLLLAPSPRRSEGAFSTVV